jgi:hypothetical protein
MKADQASRLVDEARPLLEAEMGRQERASYQALLAEEGKLRERELESRSGLRFSVCTQVIRANDLECTLEVRASVHHLHEDEVIPLDLRACLRVTPDDQKDRL